MTINGHTVDALIDTGAAITMISESFFSTLGIELKLPESNTPDFEGIVAGSRLSIRGTIDTPIRIGDFVSEPHQIQVVGDTYNNCLIGLDFLDKFFISIDASERRLRIMPPSLEPYFVGLKIICTPNKDEYKAISTTGLQIGPRRVACIQVSIKHLDMDIDGGFRKFR